uniref:Uncharacterized protein n=1 Tax=viral metagenome TaxID=1070528 RepID=A0A6C0KBM4_9ZZZZ
MTKIYIIVSITIKMINILDTLYNKLGACNDVSLAEWKDIDPVLFKKHSQGSQGSQASHIPLNTKVSNVIPEIVEVSEEKPSVVVKPPAVAAGATSKKKPTKDTAIKPLNIIMKETFSFHNSTEYIKDALIILISKEEFSKIFGLTKCAEIMSGIVNNRWNKSTALFISFLLDKEVYYNDKVIIYNKEKNTGRITIQ